MSESLIHIDVAGQIGNLVDLIGGDTKCTDFQHQIINSRVAFTAAGGAANIFSLIVPENFALIVTAIDVKVLYDTADALLLGGDFRSTDDFNPFGPYVGIGAVGTIRILIGGQQYGATAFDIGMINAGIILVILSNQTFQIEVNPHLPAAKVVTLVSRLNVYLVPQEVGTETKKVQTQFLTNTP